MFVSRNSIARIRRSNDIQIRLIARSVYIAGCGLLGRGVFSDLRKQIGVSVDDGIDQSAKSQPDIRRCQTQPVGFRKHYGNECGMVACEGSASARWV